MDPSASITIYTKLNIDLESFIRDIAISINPGELIYNGKNDENETPNIATSYVDKQLYKDVDMIKNSIKYNDDSSGVDSRDNINPYENIGNSLFINRASIKLANIDAVFNLTGSYSLSNLHSTSPYKFLDVAGAPGGFSQYLLWRLSKSTGYGVSIDTDNPSLKWNETILAPRMKYYKGYGGDITKCWEDFITKAGKVDLVVADAYTGENTLPREVGQFYLIMIECLIGISCCSIGGNFVVKFFNTVTESNAQLLYILANAFNTIALFKPISSRPESNEQYLICQKRNNNNSPVHILRTLAKQYQSESTIINIISNPIPDRFIKWLTNSNNTLIRSRKGYLIKRKEYIENNTSFIEHLPLYRCLTIWNIP